jgi:SAM-dependent methyltransferase
VVACTSLHHVADLDQVLDRLHDSLTPGGALVVVEWARERFDETTARWCFARLAPDAEDSDGVGWLHRHRDRWTASGLPWDEYLRTWAAEEGMHTGEQIVAGLDLRFHRRLFTTGPYFFADLADITEADEQAAIDNATMQANGIRYVGQPR